MATVGRYLVRYALVLVIAWIGALKYTASEAAVTQPLIAHSPSSVTPAAAPCPSRMELTFHFSRMTVEAVTREEIGLHHDLAGKVALVTGGSRGIGAAVARALADVAITYLSSRQAAENVAGELRAKGVRARAIQADQADPAAAAAVVREVAGEFGRLDILVNNAAVAVLGPVDSPASDDAALDRQVRVNYTSIVAAIRAAARVLPEGGPPARTRPLAVAPAAGQVRWQPWSPSPPEDGHRGSFFGAVSRVN